MAKTEKTPGRSSQDCDERSLLKRIAERDREALTRLYSNYYERLFRFVFRLLRSYSSTEELVNDIMLAVWRGAESYRGDSKPSTWIFGIAYRQALKRLSQRQLAVEPRMDVDQIPDRSVPALDREEWVQRGLEALPATQRMTVELVFYLGLSYEEVAAVTECPVNTVKTRMFHARRKLKEHLECISGDAFPGG